MAKFEFDLEQAEMSLDDAENLLAVFWGFFAEERPFDENADAVGALWFVNQCRTYESVLNAAWEKIRKVRKDVTATIAQQSRESKKGGEAA